MMACRVNSTVVEVCIDNIESAKVIQQAGGNRIELCSALSEGGLTPTGGFLTLVKSIVSIPVFVMVRPRSGDFVYSEQEIEIMKNDIKYMKELGADGFVFGVLDEENHVDRDKCAELLRCASPLSCTFHRAFDLTPNPLIALEEIIEMGFSRILTSGQKPTAKEGIPLIRELVQQAGDRIVILAGAGINPDNVTDVINNTGVSEVHGSASTRVPSKAKHSSNVSMGTNSDEETIRITNFGILQQILICAQNSASACSK